VFTRDIGKVLFSRGISFPPAGFVIDDHDGATRPVRVMS
jgi:hypothetical protein